MIWAGMLTDIFRVRVLGPVILAGLALACLFMAFAQSWLWLAIAVFCLRFFGQGMSTHIAVVAMSRWFIATRGRALATAALGFAFGEAFLPMIFVALMGIFHWQSLWLIAAAVALLGMPLLWTLLQQERTPAALAQSQISTGMSGQHWSRRDAITHPLFWFMVPALLGPAAFNTAFFFHQVHFAEIKGWSHLQLVAFFPFYTAVAIAAMLASGWALDRFGTARLMPFAQLPMVIAFLLFAFGETQLAAGTGFFFLALTTGANSTLPNAFWAEFYGTAHLGAIKALAMAIMVLGSAIGPGVTGLGIDLGFSLETQFLWVAGYFVLTSLLMYVGISAARPSLPVSDRA
jgi:MFS family permease